MKTLSDRDTAALRELAQLLSSRAPAEAVARALEVAAEARKLEDELRRLRAELEEARAAARAPAAAARRPEPAALDLDDDAPLGLAAPFRVGPREAKAAKDDPLAALAVQVARALSADAKEVERARLLAMALAAAQGDLDAFWTARRMRTAKAPAASRKK